MKEFEVVDITTADTAFIAYGKNLNELFANCAKAMFNIMVDLNEIDEKEMVEIKVNGIDLKSLLFNWLNELLFFYGSENLLLKRFEVEIDEKNFELKAKAFGERFDEKKHRGKTEVKSCTYHKMEIKKNDVWKARVILDI